MKDLKDRLQKNLILYIELVIYATLLAGNVFFGLEIYQKVIGEIPPGSDVQDTDIVELNELNKDLLETFEKDHEKRKEFIVGVEENYENQWNSFENPQSPFAAQRGEE